MKRSVLLFLSCLYCAGQLTAQPPANAIVNLFGSVWSIAVSNDGTLTSTTVNLHATTGAVGIILPADPQAQSVMVNMFSTALSSNKYVCVTAVERGVAHNGPFYLTSVILQPLNGQSPCTTPLHKPDFPHND